jgi:hypothetical protein
LIRQEAGQAFWIYRGKTAHVQSVCVRLTREEIADAWREIYRQKAAQQQIQEEAEQKRQQATPDPATPSGEHKPCRKKTASGTVIAQKPTRRSAPAAPQKPSY